MIDEENSEETAKNDKHKPRRTCGEQIKRLLRIVGPQLAVVLLLIAYLLFGALCFRFLDPQLANIPTTELVLFCFETLATIGYGNICPSSPLARLFTMLYSLLGIPLCMLTVANSGKHLTKAFWVIARAFRDKKLSRPLDRRRLPLPVLLVLLAIYLFFIGILRPSTLGQQQQQQPQYSFIPLENIYFGIISFATVGFGDYFPSTEGSILRLLAHLCLLSGGMIALGVWFQIARGLFKRLFCFHRHRFRHVHNVPVWFGRRRMRLSNVLEVVGQEFQASPVQIQQVLDDLDFLLLEVQSNKKSSATAAIAPERRLQQEANT